MKKGFIHYYILISCPGDLKDDIEVVNNVILSSNRNVGERSGIHLVPMYWENDSVPEAGNSGQEVINHQLLKKADGVIGLLWTRFGTPTDLYKSGTEEEIIKASDDGKDVLMYFSKKPIDPSKIDHEQYRLVQNFEKKFKGLSATYSDKEELKEKLTTALSSLIFKYVKEQENDTPLDIAKEDAISHNYTLAEFFDLGWYLSRFLFDTPYYVGEEYAKNIFIKRIDMLLYLVKSLQLISNKNCKMLESFKDNICAYGGKIYFKEIGKNNVSKIHELFNLCRTELFRKLKDKPFSSFRLGALYGSFVATIEMEVADCDNADATFLQELGSVHDLKVSYNEMLSLATKLGGEIKDNILEIDVDKYLYCPLPMYYDEVRKHAETIILELNMD